MVVVRGEEKGGFLDGEGWSGGWWEEAVVVRLGLCICKRVFDMGWISKVANSISDVFSIRHDESVTDEMISCSVNIEKSQGLFMKNCSEGVSFYFSCGSSIQRVRLIQGASGGPAAEKELRQGASIVGRRELAGDL